jgi:hypothetical protein
MRTNAAEREIDTLCDSELDSVSGGGEMILRKSGFLTSGC